MDKKEIQVFYDEHNRERVTWNELKELVTSMPEGVLMCVELEVKDYA